MSYPYEGPSEDQVMDWNIHNDHVDSDDVALEQIREDEAWSDHLASLEESYDPDEDNLRSIVYREDI